MKTNALMVLVVAMVWTQSAQAAGSSASASTSSDFKGQAVDVNVESGSIDKRPFQVSVGGAAISSSTGAQGYSGNAKYTHKGYIGHGSSQSKDGGGHDGAVLMIDTGVNARVDMTSEHKPTRIDVQAGSFTYGYIQAWTAHPDESHKARAREHLAHMEKLDQAHDELLKLHTDILSCTANCDSLINKIAPGKTLEEAKKIAGERYYESATAIQSYMKEMEKEGYHYTNSYEGKKVVGGANVVSSTIDFGLANATGIYQDLKDVGIKQHGALLKFGETSFHAAGKVNGVLVDICGQVIPFSVVVGPVDGKNNHIASSAKLCAGIGLGPVGHLQGSVTGTTDFDGYSKVSFDAELKHIGHRKSPLAAGITHEIESTRDGLEVKRTLIGGKLIF